MIYKQIFIFHESSCDANKKFLIDRIRLQIFFRYIIQPVGSCSHFSNINTNQHHFVWKLLKQEHLIYTRLGTCLPTINFRLFSQCVRFVVNDSTRIGFNFPSCFVNLKENLACRQQQLSCISVNYLFRFNSQVLGRFVDIYTTQHLTRYLHI